VTPPPSACPPGDTGTYPNCVPPAGGGGTTLTDGFFGPSFKSGPSVSCLFTHPDYAVNGSILTVSYPAGSSAQSAGAPYGGAQACAPAVSGPATALTLSYELRIPVGFQFVKGGKLPGIYGGVEPFSGGAHNPNGWSLRVMWRANGAGEIYGYTAGTTGYGDDYAKPGFNFLADGQWHTITEHVVLNTPGQSNGSATLSYDGTVKISQTGIDITNTNTPIDGLFFSTFYGGHDVSWAPTVNESIDFSNFTASAQ
jgi:hypothetical protein